MPPERAKDLFKKMHEAADGVLPVISGDTIPQGSIRPKFPAKKGGTWNAIVAEKLEEGEEANEARRRRLAKNIFHQTPDSQN